MNILSSFLVTVVPEVGSAPANHLIYLRISREAHCRLGAAIRDYAQLAYGNLSLLHGHTNEEPRLLCSGSHIVCVMGIVRLRVPAENRSDEQDVHNVQAAYISEDTGNIDVTDHN